MGHLPLFSTFFRPALYTIVNSKTTVEVAYFFLSWNIFTPIHKNIHYFLKGFDNPKVRDSESSQSYFKFTNSVD